MASPHLQPQATAMHMPSTVSVDMSPASRAQQDPQKLEQGALPSVELPPPADLAQSNAQVLHKTRSSGVTGPSAQFGLQVCQKSSCYVNRSC